MQPEIKIVPERYAVGISVRTSNQNEFNPGMGKIPGLWARFFSEDLYNKIPNRIPAGTPIGAYLDFADGVSGTYSVLAGVETIDLCAVPDGMQGITLGAGKYLVFTSKGPMPAAVLTAWTAIWQYFQPGAVHERAFLTDYEQYLGPDEVAVYISIK
jgi:predicted transcriptional regulator YdeE